MTTRLSSIIMARAGGLPAGKGVRGRVADAPYHSINYSEATLMNSNPPSPRGALALAALATLLLLLVPAQAQNPEPPRQPQQPPQGMGVSTGSALVSATRRTVNVLDPKAPLV
ncbi:MAG TPA: hypothetical protein VF508_04610, partial [Pyrinomonadaceae bacterium]